MRKTIKEILVNYLSRSWSHFDNLFIVETKNFATSDRENIKIIDTYKPKYVIVDENYNIRVWARTLIDLKENLLFKIQQWEFNIL